MTGGKGGRGSQEEGSEGVRESGFQGVAMRVAGSRSASRLAYRFCGVVLPHVSAFLDFLLPFLLPSLAPVNPSLPSSCGTIRRFTSPFSRRQMLHILRWRSACLVGLFVALVA